MPYKRTNTITTVYVLVFAIMCLYSIKNYYEYIKMKQFSKIALILFFSGTLFSCGDQQTDKTYIRVKNPQPTTQPTVIEFFAYFCPHCNKLEPKVRVWQRKLPKSIQFIRVPLTLGHTTARIYSRAFYLGKKLGVLNKSHKRIFDDFHNKKIQLQSDQQLKTLFLSLGVSAQVFDLAINDPEINQQVDQAEKMAKRFAIVSVPSFVIDGKYFTDAGMTGGIRPLFEKINFLLRKK